MALGLATAASASAQNFTATPVITSPTTTPNYLPPPIAITNGTVPYSAPSGSVPNALPINQLNPTALPTAPGSRYQTAVYTRAPIEDDGGGIIGPPDRAMPNEIRQASQIQNRTNIYDEDADFIIRTDLPGPERLYDTLKSEAMMREYIRRDSQVRAGANRNLFPEYEPLSRETSLPPRMFPRSSTWAEPNVVCHGRLYFEQPNMERTGWDFGYLSIPLSAGVFCYDMVMFPYHYGTDPCNRYDCNVGKCMPGDNTPFLLYREPWSLSGFAAEATAVGAGFFIFP